jgi:tRNA threonylcarbamoyladenosine biosynthesis protein TsaB
LKIIGLSSASNTIGAAVLDERGITAECTVSGPSVRSEKLIVLVEEALNRSKIKISDIDAVAVTIGPGSYSGLRGGLAAAKGLVQSLNIDIISVPTLDAVAYNFRNYNGTVAVAINACRDDYNIALFGVHNGAIKRMTKDMTVKLDRISEVLSKVSGEMTLVSDKDLSKDIKNKNIRLASADSAIPWAKNVAIIGGMKYENGEFGDYLSLVPEYSHKPNIREYKK